MEALILVDLQNDFCPGGALPVPHGDEVIPVANKLAQQFDLVVATQDWHPRDHGSFAANHPGKAPGDVIDLDGLPQILWPVHCVQETYGAMFVSDLDMGRVKHVVRKGTDPRIDSYSGFYDNGHRKSTGLSQILRQAGVTQVYIMGLATDVCVRFTALDARRDGFSTGLVADGSRGVELQAGEVANAIAEMRATGVSVVTSDQLGLRPGGQVSS